MTSRTKKKIWKTAAALFCLAAVFAAAAAVWRWDTRAVSFLMPGGTVITERGLRGFPLRRIPEDPVREGYAFLGWEDESGNLLAGENVRFLEDTRFSPLFTPLLNTDPGVHEPYLFADENGFLRPDGAFTRGEAAALLLPSLPQDVEPAAGFEDVAGDSACARAAGVLRALGIASGSRFRPGDPATLRDLVTMTAPFFSQTDTAEEAGPAWLKEADADRALFLTASALGWLEGFEGPDTDPDRPLTRAEAAAVLNRVLNRSVQLLELAEHGGAFPDVSPFHPYYADLMEAALPHSRRLAGGREIWTGSEPTSRLPEGLAFFDGLLYCVDENGYLITGGSWGGFLFDESGVYTSGDEELDKVVRELLDQITTEDMEPLEKLRAAYDYCVSSITYIRRRPLEFGATGWELEAAYEGLSTGYGNCYTYAASFWALARALGYDMQVWSGSVDPNRAPHGFDTLEEDGVLYIFDPELEMARKLQGSTEERFMMDPDNRLVKNWLYRW